MALPAPTVSLEDMLGWLLPLGCNPLDPSAEATSPRWSDPPAWPPDLFAVAATLAERSGLYTEPGIALSTTPEGRDRKRARSDEAIRIGHGWSRSVMTPRPVNALWSRLWRQRREPLATPAGGGQDWKAAVMQLLAIADEACSGVGYRPQVTKDGVSGFAVLVHEEYRATGSPRSRRALPAILPYLPNSLTRAVPPDRASVLPKALTPNVGCTLRSITQNLALLPGIGQVSAQWRFTSNPAPSRSGADSAAVEPFNLLIVPFPYELLASDFEPSRPPDGPDVDGYFTLRAGWLPPGDLRARRAALVEFLGALIDAAQRDGGSVHGIVLPETALTDQVAASVATSVARRYPRLELFVAGILAAPNRAARFAEPPFPRNQVFVARFSAGRRLDDYSQTKHHRWRLDRSQVANYQLGHVLQATDNWWEQIDLSDRTMVFALDHREAVISALICEDLARFDPVLPVLMSVGPNLVIALLMDGPQLARRWSARHASVLADDPGSAVLTLTSLGMVRRSKPPAGVAARACIALWTERAGSPQELDLPPDSHALLLALAAQPRRQKTLDLRRHRDGGGHVEYRLSGTLPVKLPDTSRFKWLVRT